MLAPFGVLREPHISSGRKPGPGQRAGVLDEQVGRRPAVRPRIEAGLHAEMNLRALKGDEAVSAAMPLAGTETKPAVIGKGSSQVADWEDRRYSRTHDCNLSRRPGRQRLDPSHEPPAVRMGFAHRHAGLLAAQLEDTDGMNRERAETFLRVLAEAELRRVTAHLRDSAPPQDVPGAEREAAALLGLSAVAATLGDLPDRQREAITLQYHAGLSEAETAAAMRISRGAVKAHTNRGISTLRAELETRPSARVRRVAEVLTGVARLTNRSLIRSWTTSSWPSPSAILVLAASAWGG